LFDNGRIGGASEAFLNSPKKTQGDSVMLARSALLVSVFLLPALVLCLPLEVMAQDQAVASPSEDAVPQDLDFSLVAPVMNPDGTAQLMKLCSGRTAEGATSWVQYLSYGIYVDVDTSSCGFGATPTYLVNMHGNSGNWATTGGSSAYSRTKTGFRIYVKYSHGGDLTPAHANQRGWHIQWLAIGY
jgi:hypothetical protein